LTAAKFLINSKNMKTFIEVKLPTHPITIPTSAIVFVRPFFKPDMPTPEITPSRFEYEGVWYDSGRSTYTKGGKPTSFDEYYSARKACEEVEQQKINDKYSKVKAVVYVKLLGNERTSTELVENTYEELVGKLVGDN
jgi:hypothetical protein